MSQWIRFFVGTPARLLGTACAIGVLYGLINPEGLGRAVNALLASLMAAIEPFTGPLLEIGVIALLFAWALKALFGKKGGKR